MVTFIGCVVFLVTLPSRDFEFGFLEAFGAEFQIWFVSGFLGLVFGFGFVWLWFGVYGYD